MKFNIETERETDGRWIAEVINVPGALAYGKTKTRAMEKAKHIAEQIRSTNEEGS